MRQFLPTAVGLLLIVSSLATALGGCGSAPSRKASSQAPEPEPIETGSEETAEPAKQGPDCSDGGCIPCGDAVCPQGFYCDESTAKPACQWVPTCTSAVGCACVKSSLSDKCSCSERQGGTYVHCAN